MNSLPCNAVSDGVRCTRRTKYPHSWHAGKGNAGRLMWWRHWKHNT